MKTLTASPILTVAASVSERAEPVKLKMPAQKLWHKVTKHPHLRPYNRLAVYVTLANALAFSVLLGGVRAVSELSLAIVAFLALINFSVATLIRNQYVVNFLFAIATCVPTTAPLSLRWALGKIYHFGGIHVGGYFSGTLWFFLYTFLSFGKVPLTMQIVNSLHCLILTAVIILALPKIRARHHNMFEIIGRYGTWTSVVLFWVQAFITPNPAASIMLPIVTLSIMLPWLQMKKVAVKFERPSNHAVLADFNYGETPFAGSSTDLSFNGIEWHSFANVPLPGREGFKLTISRAGDWTGKLIDTLPEKIYVKGIATAGVGNVEKLFKRVIWVATGSGIGPCLPHLMANTIPSRLVWSTRNPQKTYGQNLVNDILSIHPDSIIWDTDKNGKPNLAELAYEAYKKFDAEAVICISNKKLTFELVYEMESRGIPAFGAIWDS